MDIQIFSDIKDKLAEASYFLDRMIKEKNNNRDAFRFNTSAFVTAAVSVEELLSTQANYNLSPEFNSWRAEQVRIFKEDQYVKIIYEQRRKTVHREPLQPQTDVTVYPTVVRLELEVQPVTLSQGLNNIMMSSQVSNQNAAVMTTTKSRESSHEITRSESTHYFKGHREKDVISLCDEHLHKLEKLVELCEVEYKKIGIQ